MGAVLNWVFFLLKRAPEIYETGKIITRSLGGGAALTEGDAGAAPDGGGRIGAIEQELRVLNIERERLSEDIARLSREITTLRHGVERSRRVIRLLLVLFVAFVAAGLFLAAVILSRFP